MSRASLSFRWHAGSRSRTRAVLSVCLSTLAIAGNTALAKGSVQQPAPVTTGVETLSVEELRPGMTGIGYTVVRGTEPEEFRVEILGVLENTLPKQDIIIARLSGLGLEESGVSAGMSGSPVYIDGKLIGAVSYRLGSFPTEPIAGITPIDNMLGIVETEAQRPSPVAAASGTADLLATAAELIGGEAPTRLGALRPASAGTGITPIATPVTIGGAHPEIVRRLSPMFEALGWQAAVGGTSLNPRLAEPFSPGSAVATQLMRGDVTFTATGTVTWVEGDRLLAFGHPFMQAGSVDFPMAGAEVLMVLNSLAASQKLAAAGTEVVGSIRQDRQAGILGVVGPTPQMIPVTIDVAGEGLEERFDFELIADKSLAPTFFFLGLATGLQSVGAMWGDSALQVDGEVYLDAPYDSIRIQNLFSTPVQAFFPLSQTILSIFQFLYDNPFEPVAVRGIDLDITVRNDLRVAEITRVWADRVDLAPGDAFQLTVWLKPYRQPETPIEIPLRIPEDLAPGPITVLVGDAAVVAREETNFFQGNFAPRNMEQLIRLLNNVRPSDRIYYQLSRPDEGAFYGGQPMPSLPPSILQVLSADQTSGETVRLRKTVLWEDAEEVEYVVTGEHRIELNVRRR